MSYNASRMAPLKIELPESLLLASGQSREEFAREAPFLLLLKLFELGRVSSGKAAELCPVSSFQPVNSTSDQRLDRFGEVGAHGPVGGRGRQFEEEEWVAPGAFDQRRSCAVSECAVACRPEE